MFTGIIEEVGKVAQVTRNSQSYSLAFEADCVLDGTVVGDSIAVDGVCLTVTQLTDGRFEVGLAPETLSRTTLGELVEGDRVNLERPLTPSSRMGGHFVQGHIDGTGIILERQRDGDSVRLEIEFDPAQMRYVANKGFIAVDGISLTVIDAKEDRFSLMLVAYTQEHVTLAGKKVGDLVNIEVDILAKYVDRRPSTVDRATSGVARRTAYPVDPRWIPTNPGEPGVDGSNIDAALSDLKRGRMIIVVDDESRENEGDLVVAAEFATPEIINFMAREARGLICVAMIGADLDRLRLPLMVAQANNISRFGSPFTISVDAREGVTTGISSFDRARTIGVLINPATTTADLSSPGHIFPLRAHDDGVNGRRGHTEAGVDLTRAAGLAPAAVICEIMADDGTMARRDDLEIFASRHKLQMVSIEEIVQLDIQRRPAPSFQQSDTASLPTRFGEFTVSAFRDKEGREHLALHVGDLTDAPLVRVHSECLTGDVLGSLRCDCGDQLASAMRTISEEGRGVILYLRQEGRGIGLSNKIKAYALQDEGMDTVEANHCLGFSADLRDYSVAASMLLDLGVDRLRLMTNNPHKVTNLEANGIEVVERVPLQMASRPENQRYLETKASKLAHILSGGLNRS